MKAHPEKSSSPQHDSVLQTKTGPQAQPERGSVSAEGRQVIAGRYAILGTLGRGGMGEVWHAFDLKLRVDVALKSLRTDRAQQDVEALRREVRNAREVISPNVCRIFDLVVEEGKELVSMEYIDGITLAELLQKGNVELHEATEIAAQFLSGLQAIHQAGLVHRDFKPENVMITRTGRVVVMDFGIAKPVAQISETISGTPCYMAPEQLEGRKLDPRSDLFAAGVVLSEMIQTEGVKTKESREALLRAIRQEPLKLPDHPWSKLIARAVAKNYEERFGSALSMMQALQEVAQRSESDELKKPYPGLSAFTADNAEFFFGRELEVEGVIKKLQQLHLMAIIGPSGAGKTSFLQAGLIPSLPENWSCIVCQPGDSPNINLAHALINEFSGDTEALHKMFQFEEIHVALSLLRQWRNKHADVLVIVDRFEELFTLNTQEIQSRFAELLERAALEADVRIVLAMRDDFLLQCHRFSALAPIFNDLTPILPLDGADLRRAIVQPALKCGYRFEDDALVEEVFSDVEKERGALPLMAFAVLRLWEKRDRQSGLLSRSAYKEIGGVAGALAQHAEDTMDRIGTDKQEIVREIFRNLTTAQNTRAARETEDLLSVFTNRKDAEDTLRKLIDARLLTSFEEKPDGKRRIEIIHESLLSAWPRLVRWQTQDADGAQLRDQLRQSSQFWNERGRPAELLWTGVSYKEFELWRERYPGGLTANEESFANAMLQYSDKRRRQRKIVFGSVIVVLLGIIAIIASFWHQATISRDRAVEEAKRAEASKILTLAGAKMDADPSTKLSYALASLEVYDSQEGRRFALKALSEGIPARVIEMPIRPLTFIQFSPDGKWIAAGGTGGVQLVPRDGSPPLTFSDSWPADGTRGRAPQFSPDGKFVIWRSAHDPKILRVWSLNEKKQVRTFHLEGYTICSVTGNSVFFITNQKGSSQFDEGVYIIRSWDFYEKEPVLLGNWSKPQEKANIDIDSHGKWIAYTKGKGVYLQSLEALGESKEILLGSHAAETRIVSFHPSTKQLVSADSTGEIRLWSVIEKTQKPLRVIPGRGGTNNLWFDPRGVFLNNLWFDSKGLFLVAAYDDSKTLCRWDLTAPEDAQPLVFRHMDEESSSVAFDRETRWMAIAWHQTLALYPITQPYPYIFRGIGKLGSLNVRFTPDGKSFVNGFSVDGIRMWNMPGEKNLVARTIRKPGSGTQSIDVDQTGKSLLAGTPDKGLHLISISDGTVSALGGLPGRIHNSVTFSADGRFAAASAGGPLEIRGIEIWDLHSGSAHVLEESKGKEFFPLKYAPNGTLFSGDSEGNLTEWNIKNGSHKVLGKGKGILFRIAITNDGRYVAATTLSTKRPGEIPVATSELVLYDLKEQKSHRITSHGNRVLAVAFDVTGTKLITGDIDGNIRVGSINGSAPHLLMKHEGTLADVVVHPRGEWLAATELWRPVVSIWRMPQGEPFHTLPHEEFLKRLRELTNVRTIADKNSATGYRIQYDQFPGWEKAPEW